MFHLSVSSLRHYENIGLVTPEYVEPGSGYRYYGARQFEALNSVRYLRALDMPLSEIADFLQNRDVERITEKLLMQKQTVMAKQAELKRIERKIDNRLRAICDAKNSIFDQVQLVRKEACRIVWMSGSLTIEGSWDLETPIRKLDREQSEAVVFLGKIGVGISVENLNNRRFDNYNGIFLIVEDEDRAEGETIELPETDCVSVRFHGSHAEASEQYEKLLSYIVQHGLKIDGFSREITMIDYGITRDREQFVTEISIPVVRL